MKTCSDTHLNHGQRWKRKTNLSLSPMCASLQLWAWSVDDIITWPSSPRSCWQEVLWWKVKMWNLGLKPTGSLYFSRWRLSVMIWCLFSCLVSGFQGKTSKTGWNCSLIRGKVNYKNPYMYKNLHKSFLQIFYNFDAFHFQPVLYNGHPVGAVAGIIMKFNTHSPAAQMDGCILQTE